MKIRLTLFCLAFSVIAAAQVPGYMGKRFSIGYSLNAGPSLWGPSAGNNEDGELGINLLHSVNLEYGIRNRTNFCASVQFFKTGLSNDATFTAPSYDPQSSYSENVQTDYKDPDKLPMQLHTTNISLGLKFFKRGFLAPVGKYTKLDLTIFLNNVTYDKNSFYYDGTTKVTQPIGTGTFKSTSFAIGYSLGRQHVYFNCLIVDTGVRFAVVPNYLLNEAGSQFNDNYNPPVERQFKKVVNERIFGSQLINFHIGLSFLAF